MIVVCARLYICACKRGHMYTSVFSRRRVKVPIVLNALGAGALLPLYSPNLTLHPHRHLTPCYCLPCRGVGVPDN